MSDVVTEETVSEGLDEVRANFSSPKRFRFSIRLLLLLTLAAAVAVSWGSSRIREVQREAEIVARLQSSGINIGIEPIQKPPTFFEKVFGKRFSKQSWKVKQHFTDGDTQDAQVDVLVTLAGLENLEEIETDHLHNNLLEFSRFENLKKLKLHAGWVLETLAGAEDLQNLRELHLGQADLLKSVKPLVQLKRLEVLVLDFDDSSKLEDLDKVIPQMTGLRSVSTEIWESDNLKCFADLEQLEELDLSLVSNDIKSLEGLGPNLRKLSLGFCDNIEDWSALDSMTAMTELTISGVNVSSLEFLSNMKELKQLSITLSKTNLSPDLKPFHSLTQLESLSISHRELFALDSLAQFSSLERLNLRGSVELKTLDGIESMQGLKTIYILDATGLVDIRALSKLKRLEDVWITGKKNPPKQWQVLKASMPQVRFGVW